MKLDDLFEISNELCKAGKQIHHLDFSICVDEQTIVLTAKVPISKDAYLGARKKRYAEVSITIAPDFIGINITADDLLVGETPFAFQNIKNGELFFVNTDRTKLGTIILMEEFLRYGHDIIFDNIESLQFSMEFNIRTKMIERREEEFCKKLAKKRKTDTVDPDKTLLYDLSEIVLTDIERRLRKTIEQYKETGFDHDHLQSFKQTYYGDIRFIFDIEKDEKTDKKKLEEIMFDYWKVGNPFFRQATTLYSVDGYTAGQWIYIYYYACKGSAWFDYDTYCKPFDRLEQELLDEIYFCFQPLTK